MKKNQNTEGFQKLTNTLGNSHAHPPKPHVVLVLALVDFVRVSEECVFESSLVAYTWRDPLPTRRTFGDLLLKCWGGHGPTFFDCDAFWNGVACV